MRRTFVKVLSEEAEKNKNILLLNGDLGFGVFENFIEKHPQQYLNMGVSEANMIGVAAGLAISGKVVYAYSIVPFAIMRAFEQVRNDVCMQRANVRIVGVGAGLAYGELGPTHHSIQDIAIMRSLPGMTVIAPGDPVEVEGAIKASYSHQGPMYIRIAKRGEPIVHTEGIDFTIGKAIEVRPGNDITVIVTGNLLPNAVAVSEALKEKGISVRVISMPTVKPLDVDAIKKAADETRVICTVEEHSIIGGLGSAVAETVAELSAPPRFKRFGISDVDTKIAGTHEHLQALHRLTPAQLSEDILHFFTEKI